VGGATDLAFAAERWVEAASERLPISLALAVCGVLLVGFLIYRFSRRRKKQAGHKG
jgi:hypothetical protein